MEAGAEAAAQMGWTGAQVAGAGGGGVESFRGKAGWTPWGAMGVSRHPERFGLQILADLVAEALAHPKRHPLLGLHVDVRNTSAVQFYAKEHFQPFGKPELASQTGVTTPRMIRLLRQERP
jgi:hypothetical protein